jgi:hypothetical protein
MAKIIGGGGVGGGYSTQPLPLRGPCNNMPQMFEFTVDFFPSPFAPAYILDDNIVCGPASSQ